MRTHSPDGLRFEFPIRYYDYSTITANLLVHARKIEPWMPSNRLKPILPLPGTAMISLIASDFRRLKDAEAYREFAIAVPVQYGPRVNLPELPLLFNPFFSPRWYSKPGL